MMCAKCFGILIDVEGGGRAYRRNRRHRTSSPKSEGKDLPLMTLIPGSKGSAETHAKLGRGGIRRQGEEAIADIAVSVRVIAVIGKAEPYQGTTRIRIVKP